MAFRVASYWEELHSRVTRKAASMFLSFEAKTKKRLAETNVYRDVFLLSIGVKPNSIRSRFATTWWYVVHSMNFVFNIFYIVSTIQVSLIYLQMPSLYYTMFFKIMMFSYIVFLRKYYNIKVPNKMVNLSTRIIFSTWLKKKYSTGLIRSEK